MHEVAHGVLFYASLYTNGVLLLIGASTGRFIFVLLILLTIGLTAYLMFLLSHNADHLARVGTWAEKTFASQLEKLKRFF